MDDFNKKMMDTLKDRYLELALKKEEQTAQARELAQIIEAELFFGNSTKH